MYSLSLTHMTKLIKLYTLNVFSLLYVNYILIKLKIKGSLKRYMTSREDHCFVSCPPLILTPQSRFGDERGRQRKTERLQRKGQLSLSQLQNSLCSPVPRTHCPAPCHCLLPKSMGMRVGRDPRDDKVTCNSQHVFIEHWVRVLQRNRTIYIFIHTNIHSNMYIFIQILNIVYIYSYYIYTEYIELNESNIYMLNIYIHTNIHSSTICNS